MLTRKRRVAFFLAGIIGISVITSSVIAASPAASVEIRRHSKWRRHRYYRHRRSRDIDRLIAIGAIHLIARAISDLGRRPQEVVYVCPPPARPASSQPTYTPSVRPTVVTVRNSTNWYVVVDVNGTEIDLYPGRERSVSWTHTGREYCIRAWAYRDRRYRELVGTYEGNLVGYQAPWILEFDHDSFV